MVTHDERHERLARSLVHAWGYIFSTGAAIAIFFVIFVLVGVWGRFFVTFQQFTFWVWFFEALTFVGEIVLLYTLYANWERMRAYRLARLGMVLLLNIDQWFQMFFIDVIASQMLTPTVQGATDNTSYLLQFLNPTNLPLTVHRTIGNIAWAGAHRHRRRRLPVPAGDPPPGGDRAGARAARAGAGPGGHARGRAGARAQPRGRLLGLGRAVGDAVRLRLHHRPDLGRLQLRQGDPAPLPGQLVPDDVRLDLQHLPGPVRRAGADLHLRGRLLLAPPQGGRPARRGPPSADRPGPADPALALRDPARLVRRLLSGHRGRPSRQAVLGRRSRGPARLLLPLEGDGADRGHADRALRAHGPSSGPGCAPP